jgi:hypothetical protein
LHPCCIIVWIGKEIKDKFLFSKPTTLLKSHILYIAMISFQTWLEGRIISAGGAFGKDVAKMHQSKPPLQPLERDKVRFAQMDQRVRFGRSIEEKVVDALRIYAGWTIVPAEKSQDMFDKIDAWVVKDGAKTSIQIKYRDTGTGDILFEVEKNGKPGRDMVGKALLYAVLNKEGNLIRELRPKCLRNLSRVVFLRSKQTRVKYGTRWTPAVEQKK